MAMHKKQYIEYDSLKINSVFNSVLATAIFAISGSMLNRSYANFKELLDAVPR